MHRYVLYVAAVAGAAAVGAALTGPAANPPVDPPPATIAAGDVVADIAGGVSTSAQPPNRPAVGAAPSKEAPGPTIPPPVTSGHPASTHPPPADVHAHGDHDHDHQPGDEGNGEGGPLGAGDVAAQFTLAALSDRFDTAAADRAATIAAWATGDVAAAFPAMDPTARANYTVRAVTIDAVTTNPVDADTWSATVEATVTESVAAGPTTDTPIRLELDLDVVADVVQVVAAELTTAT